MVKRSYITIVPFSELGIHDVKCSATRIVFSHWRMTYTVDIDRANRTIRNVTVAVLDGWCC